MSDDHLDRLVERLNDGDLEAAERAFTAYEPYLRMAVRRRISGRLRAKLDSMDVVQSAWADVLRGFRDTGWRFADRSHLRAFLLRIVYCRLIDRQRQHHQALTRERSLDEVDPHELPRSAAPRPSEVAEGQEAWERLLNACPPRHQEIVRLRRQGLRLTEIAEQTGLHEGSVRRILYDLARRLSVSRRTATRSHGEPTDDHVLDPDLDPPSPGDTDH
jgi:RNA polymerase sigma factor (sigma-70 family)